MSHTTLFGKTGEDLANSYLIEKGYTPLQKNFKTSFGEIDLVMRDGKYLVAVEVKARNNIEFGYPEESITKTKLEKIKKSLILLKEDNLKYQKLNLRIDAVAILFSKDLSPEITHFTHIGY